MKNNKIILTPAKKPISRVHLKGCMVLGGCGAGCGPLNAPGSDSAGLLRFHTDDLRNMQNLTAIDEQGNEREFTELEMRELLTSYRLELTWE